MPIEVNVIMDISQYQRFEESVIVPIFTKVRFIARVHEGFFRRFNNFDPVSFRLYFENRPPKGFSEVHTKFLDPYFYRRNSPLELQDVILAEGTVEEAGQYKYGIQGFSGNVEIFDEDPFLIVTENGFPY